MATTTYTDTTCAVAAIGARTDSAGAAVDDVSAEELRLPSGILTEGYLSGSSSFEVTEQAVPDMTVKVGSGVAKADTYVVAGEAAGQGNYIVRLDVTDVDVTVPAADAAQTRTDEIWLVVADNAYDASSRALPRIGYRKGDLGGAAPGADSNWEASVKLATITVAAAVTTITDSDIADERTAAGIQPTLLSLDGNQTVTGNLTVTGDVSVGDDLTLTDDVTLATGSVLTWGGDTNLYRSSANKLETDDAFECGSLTASGTHTITGPLSLDGVNLDDLLEDMQAGDGGFVGTQQTTTSTSYTNLATVGPSCSIALNDSRECLVIVGAQMMNTSSASPVFMSLSASGATTIGASDSSAAQHNGSGNSEQYCMIAIHTLNAGTTTFTAKYRVDGGTGRFSARHIVVIPMN